MDQSKPIKPARKSKTMNFHANTSPMDDIKKMGDILMRRTSEKEYFRFLHIQEQCQLKWQATIDELGKLKREHEKCALIKADLEAKLQHIYRMWIKEKQIRRTAQSERNLLEEKVEHTYDFLRNSLLTDENQPDNGAVNDVDLNDAQLNDEITSTGSFLSNLSAVSSTDDDFLEKRRSQGLSTEFETIFGARCDTIENSFRESSPQMNRSLFEKTFHVKQSSEIKNDDEIDSSQEVLIPPKRTKNYVHVSENFTRAKLSDDHFGRSFEVMSSVEIDSNPIYERIDDDERPLHIDNRKNDRRTETAVVESTEISLAHNCQHTFSLRTVAPSVVCFVCYKKFRFGILAFKCTTCKVFVHHDCKAQFKTSRQWLNKHVQKYSVSEFVHHGHTEGPSIPALIVHCVNEVETRGLSERGIYRVSGSEKDIKALKNRFFNDDQLPNLTNIDMHVICGCIKIFLRGLCEPLIPTRKWMAFSNAVISFDGDYQNGNIQKNLQFEINRLPKANRDTLAFLVLHLQRVATCDAVQMPISNLAKVFGPTVVGYSKAEPDNTTILGETIIQQNVMQHFLNISTDYWFSFICEDLSR